MPAGFGIARGRPAGAIRMAAGPPWVGSTSGPSNQLMTGLLPLP
jgi:hypothetical protein